MRQRGIVRVKLLITEVHKFEKKARIPKWNYDRVQVRTTTSWWTSPHLSLPSKELGCRSL